MSGTDIGYGATRHTPVVSVLLEANADPNILDLKVSPSPPSQCATRINPRTHTFFHSAEVLSAWYERRCATETVLDWAMYCASVYDGREWSYDMCGTEVAYGATRERRCWTGR
eukprot:1412716-Rhodomonas_salina.1